MTENTPAPRNSLEAMQWEISRRKGHTPPRPEVEANTTAPLEFQAKWDYVESHGLHTVTPRRGYVVTLEDSAGHTWSGDSLQGAIDAHAAATADSRLEYLEAVADGMPEDHDWGQYGPRD